MPQNESREWLPAAYQDEVIPPPRATPNDWIVRLPGDGLPALAPIEEGMEPKAIAEGQIVQFDWMVDMDRIELTIDGAVHRVDDDPPPAPEGGYLCFVVVGDPDTLSLSIFDLVQLLREYGADDGTYDVHCYAWSTNSVPFRFTGGRFEEVQAE
jgi:hypothetical protein